MDYVKPDVMTICMGQAASGAALILSCGTKGKRMALPDSRIMIHQPLGGAQGQATDIQIQAKEMQRVKERLTQILAERSGSDYKKVLEDCERDNFLSPEEAINYGKLGLIDKILVREKEGEKK